MVVCLKLRDDVDVSRNVGVEFSCGNSTSRINTFAYKKNWTITKEFSWICISLRFFSFSLANGVFYMELKPRRPRMLRLTAARMTNKYNIVLPTYELTDRLHVRMQMHFWDGS